MPLPSGRYGAVPTRAESFHRGLAVFVPLEAVDFAGHRPAKDLVAAISPRVGACADLTVRSRRSEIPYGEPLSCKAQESKPAAR